jgi:hypothetical protein
VAAAVELDTSDAKTAAPLQFEHRAEGFDGTRDNPWGDAVSNPCLVLVDGSWRLYQSAGLD